MIWNYSIFLHSSHEIVFVPSALFLNASSLGLALMQACCASLELVVYIKKFGDDMIKPSVNKTNCTGLDLDSLAFDLNI